jgi:hypothetical protein
MKLLLHSACNNVLQDPQFGASLISVFHAIAFMVPEGQEFPANAVVPKEWAIFCKWSLLPEEYGKNYTCLHKLFWPDGTVFAEAKLEAVQPTKDGMAFVQRLNGFPVGQQGNLRIVQTIESDGVIVGGPDELLIAINDPIHTQNLFPAAT